MRRRPKSAADILRNRKRESETNIVTTRRKKLGNHEVQDFSGNSYSFRDPDIASLFSTIDAIQERIIDKYFSDDLEYEEGVKLANRLKSQLRRLNNDLILLLEIQRRGIPDEEDS